MKDCLEMNLKGVISKKDTPKLGALSLFTHKIDNFSENACVLRFDCYGDITVKASDGAYFALSYADLSDETKHLTEYTFTASQSPSAQHAIYCGNVSGRIDLFGKYDLGARFGNSSTVTETNYSFNFEELSFSDKITKLYLNAGGFAGDIAAFENIPLERIEINQNIVGDISKLNTQNLSFARIGNPSIDPSSVWGLAGDIASLTDATQLTTLAMNSQVGIFGNIANLGALTSLTSLSIFNTGINGAVEDFVAAQVTNGRTTNSTGMAVFGAFLHLTFGGSKVVSNSTNSWLKWESASKIMMPYGNGSSAAACTSMYVKGYTLAEIAEKTAPGGVWEGITVYPVDDPS